MPDQGKIFISYGRKDAAAFVDKLESDLRQAGFVIFRDITDLQAPHPWDTQLEAALNGSDTVIAVLTPHAVRTGREGDSVCLDELHMARFANPPKPIVPIMLIPCSPPMIICRLQFVDFNVATKDGSSYQRAFAQLMDTIRAVLNGRALPNRTVDLEPLDFDLYLKAKTRGFVGRQWLTAEVLDAFAATDAPPVLLLVGEPGWGKTAFAGHLLDADPEGRLISAHFCRFDRNDTADPHHFVESIAATAALRVEAYHVRLHALIRKSPELFNSQNAAEKFERLVLEPLSGLDSSSLAPLPRYILVDGLDEATTSDGKNELRNLLVRSASLLPPWLKLIVTTRDRSDIVDVFPQAAVVRFDRHDPRNLSDVTQLIETTLKRPIDGGTVIALPPLIDKLIKAIGAKADGNAYYALQLANEVRRSGMDAQAIDALPRETVAFSRALFERRFDPNGAQWHAAREILEMILVTASAVPISLAAAARADPGEYATRAVVESLSEWIEVDQDAMRLRHALCKEFLGLKSSPFFTNSALGAQRLAEYSTVQATPPEPLKRYFGMHEIHWIASSVQPAQFGDRLRLVLERRFNNWDDENFRPLYPGGPLMIHMEGENFFHPVDGPAARLNLSMGGAAGNIFTTTMNGHRMFAKGLLPEQRTLLEKIVPTVDSGVLGNLMDFIFAQAKTRFEASYDQMRQEAYDEQYNHELPKDDDNNRVMRAALNIAQFGSLVICNAVEIRPDLRPLLKAALLHARELFRVIALIDANLGSYLPSLQRWFVPVATSVDVYADVLRRKLATEPGLNLWR